MRARIDRLSHGLADADGPSVEVRPQVERREDGTWTVTMHTRQGTHEGLRQFEARSCEEVAELVTQITAMLLDETQPEPQRAARAPSNAPTSPPRAAPAPEPPPSPQPASPEDPEQREEPEPSLRFAAGGVAEVGALPAATGGGSLAVAIRLLDLVEVRIRLYGLAPSSADVGTATAEGALLGIGLFGCVTAPVAPVELGGCLGVDVGGLTAASSGVDAPSRAWITYLAGSALLRAAVSLVGPLVAALEVGLELPVQRTRFLVDGRGEAWQIALVAGRIGLDLEVELR